MAAFDCGVVYAGDDLSMPILEGTALSGNGGMVQSSRAASGTQRWQGAKFKRRGG